MHPNYANGMPPTPPGYPYHSTPQPYYWQPPKVYHRTPQEFDAYGNQAAWPDQSMKPDQGWTNENDNSAQVHRDIDVVEVARKVLPPPPKSLPVKPQRVSDGSKPSSTNPDGSTVQAGIPSPKATLINKNMFERPSPKSTSIEPLVNNNTLEQPSPKSTSTEHIHVPKHRDANLRVDIEEHPNLAPFEMGQEHTGDTFMLLTATTKPPSDWVLIGPDYRRSKPSLEASPQVIVAITHFEILRHWSTFKIIICESSITGYHFNSSDSDREGRARKAKFSHESNCRDGFSR